MKKFGCRNSTSEFAEEIVKNMEYITVIEATFLDFAEGGCYIQCM
jgi:hypothetical protein